MSVSDGVALIQPFADGCATRGAARVKMASDHSKDVSMGCCVGQAWINAARFGTTRRTKQSI
jgi:hypothetical protein